MRKKEKFILSVFLCVLITGCSSIPKKTWAPPANGAARYNKNLRDQGLFVSVPTYIGFVIGLPTLLLSFVIVPLCEDVDKKDGTFDGMALAFTPPALVSNVVGTPFRFVKFIVWDTPRKILTDEEDREVEPNRDEMEKL